MILETMAVAWAFTCAPVTRIKMERFELDGATIGQDHAKVFNVPATVAAFSPAPNEIGHVLVSQYGQLERTIESYLALENGWDGFDATKPSVDQVQALRRLVAELPGGVPVPSAMVSSQGSVGLYWDSPTFFADLEIEPDLSTSFFSKNRISSEESFLEFPAAGDLSSHITSTLRSLSA
jgi:hypothetical protein